jgi:hypothetical protein
MFRHEKRRSDAIWVHFHCYVPLAEMDACVGILNKGAASALFCTVRDQGVEGSLN